MGPLPPITEPGLNVALDQPSSGEEFACQRADQQVQVVVPVDITEMHA